MKDIVRNYFGQYRRTVLFIVILLILQVILQILIIYSIKPIIAESIMDVDTATIIKFGIVMLVLIASSRSVLQRAGTSRTGWRRTF